MIRLRHKLLIHAFRGFDQVVLIGTLLVLQTLIFERGDFAYLKGILEDTYSPGETLGFLALFLSWFAIFSAIVRYDANRFTNLGTTLLSIVKATTVSAFFLFVFAEVFALPRVDNAVAILFWIVGTLLLILSRVAIRYLLMTVRRSGYNCRHVVLVGTNTHALDLARRIEARPELGYRIGGFVSETELPEDQRSGPNNAVAPWSVIASIQRFRVLLEQGTVDEVLICLPLKERFQDIYEIVQCCRDVGAVVRYVPADSDLTVFSRVQIELFEQDHVITFFRENLLVQLLVKRAMDLVISGTLLILLSPLMLATAVAIKATSPGPVFFVQERIGMNRRRFKLYKFRSMVVDAESLKQALAALNEMDGPVFKVRNDPRVTRVGRFIRKTSIDELPQLWNVFKGEMSLVGPRPPLATEVDKYDWIHRRRLSIKPGMTCLWQVSGRNNLPFSKWMELDRKYVENWSIWLDVQILFKTIPVVLFGWGAS